jgi:hypothetical protein
MTAATTYCIWYRIGGDPAKARAAANALLRDLSLAAGVTGRILVRRDDPSTWMEVFENVVDTTRFDAALEDATARCGIEHLIDGRRHVERFADLP